MDTLPNNTVVLKEKDGMINIFTSGDIIFECPLDDVQERCSAARINLIAYASR